jgi:hypothetical protein
MMKYLETSTHNFANANTQKKTNISDDILWCCFDKAKNMAVIWGKVEILFLDPMTLTYLTWETIKREKGIQKSLTSFSNPVSKWWCNLFTHLSHKPYDECNKPI